MDNLVIVAASSFAAVILVGSLLVAVNDWLEARHSMAKVSATRELRRIDGVAHGRNRQFAPRGATRLVRTRLHGKQRELLADWF